MLFDKSSPIGQLQADTFRFYKVRDMDVYIKAWPLLRLLFGRHEDYMLGVMTSEQIPNQVIVGWIRVPHDLKKLQRVRATDMPESVQVTLNQSKAEEVMEALESALNDYKQDLLKEIESELEDESDDAE